MGRRALLCALVSGALAVAACGAETFAPPEGSGRGGQVVHVELADGAVRPNPGAVGAGDVQVEVRNASMSQRHELVVLRSGLPADRLPLRTGLSQVDEEAAGEVVGYVSPGALPPLGSSTIMVTLAPGDYVLLCNQPGHYEAGMRSAFTVG